MMESQCATLASPYTHIRVTLPSSLHVINSQLTLPLQWQSVKCVGIDLWTPVFTHSQLCVALSRATVNNQMYVLFPLYGSMWRSSIWLKTFSMGRVQRNRHLYTGSFLLVRGPISSIVVCSILYHFLIMWKLVEGLLRKAWRVFSMQLMQLSPILSPDHQSTSQRG